MAKDPGKALIARLEKIVADYQDPPFRLANDLACAVRVRSVKAPEAVIMYCARILEAMAPRVLRELELIPGNSVFSNLLVLARYQLMPPVELTWAHALRSLGNKIRHMTGDLKQTDADLALFFTECWLEWFFCENPPKKRRLKSLTRDGQPLRLCTNADLEPVIKVVRDLETNRKCTPVKALKLGARTCHMTPVIPALLAGAMIGQKWFTEAQEILTEALEIHPDDLRLKQLVGLSYSRQRNLHEALKWLEPLIKLHRDDDETDGILAGVYKRLWDDTQDRRLLERAHSAYRQGWEREKTNSYLGINAAATALWLDRMPLARRLATEVEALFSEGDQALRRSGRDPQTMGDYWTQATWPEAMLILGRLAEARRLYRAAFAGDGALPGDAKVTREQAVKILRKLGLAAADDNWFDTAGETPKPDALRVAVTGHRRLAEGVDFGERVRAALEQLRASTLAGHGADLVVLSALAEGADRLVAATALGEPFRGHLEVALPLEVADYSQDFKTPQSTDEFQHLLSLADVIHFPPSWEQPAKAESQHDDLAEARKHRGVASRRTPPLETVTGDQRNLAYQWAGHKVVDEAHALVAIWDGQPAQGVGGTGEIVAYARDRGLPLAWINSKPPYEVTWERMPAGMLSDKC